MSWRGSCRRIPWWFLPRHRSQIDRTAWRCFLAPHTAATHIQQQTYWCACMNEYNVMQCNVRIIDVSVDLFYLPCLGNGSRRAPVSACYNKQRSTSAAAGWARRHRQVGTGRRRDSDAQRPAPRDNTCAQWHTVLCSRTMGVHEGSMHHTLQCKSLTLLKCM